MSAVTPDRAGLDAELDAAQDAIARASAALVDLEAHPGYGLLRPGGFTGVSARRRDETLTTVAELHRDLALYRHAVAAAREARGSRAKPSGDELAAAYEALHGDAVTVAEEAVPLQRRGLLGPTSEVTRTSADALLARMTAAFDAVSRVVADVAAVWDTVAAQLGPADRALDEVRAADLPGVADAAGLAARLEALRAAVLTDPLAHTGTAAPVPAAALADVEADLARAREDLAEARALRTGLDDRVAELTTTIDGLAAAESALVDVAARVARLVVAVPGLPVPARRAPALRSAVREAHALAGAGRWDEATAAFTTAAADAAAARERAAADHAVLEGLLDRRAELRGRLGALRAKAGARGRGEDLALDALHTRARELLWTAPCDLAAATVAVRAYQRALEAGT
ncbi:hypothetical protein [Actinomycetospora sp. TBRC 11914]|uniref:hypothetical protein n=1 Tax=Actinomycetospora sp. TBRC 11914 TaxID=2729387 RepID=UPI00145CC046|nr:hypothetical protein [Actinomycetospora sp. TBRC 11914]NMO92377.1 hypothetical protein [Actinomycetospora sp. TBRC 11914]